MANQQIKFTKVVVSIRKTNDLGVLILGSNTVHIVSSSGSSYMSTSGHLCINTMYNNIESTVIKGKCGTN